MVSLKWIGKHLSTDGARRWGGRFNPPLSIAQSAFGIEDGFGFLYTATNPVACLFECKHVLRGLGGDEFQVLAVNPSLLITLEVESDRVLDLRDKRHQQALGLSYEDLRALDQRYEFNRRGQPTDLQRLGTAIYQSGRFSGLLAPSRYDDIVSCYSFHFLPDELKAEVKDVENTLDSLVNTLH